MGLTVDEIRELPSGTNVLLTVPEVFKETEMYENFQYKGLQLIGTVYGGGNDPTIRFYSTTKRVDGRCIYSYVYITKCGVFGDGNRPIDTSTSSEYYWEVTVL